MNYHIVVGAHVRHKDHPDYGNGRIAHIHQNGKSLAVEFENRTGLAHDCAGHTKKNFGRWTKASSLELINPFKAGDTVQMAALDQRAYPGFYYDSDYAGKNGSVLSVDDSYAIVSVASITGSQFVPTADLTLVKVDPVEAVKKATPKVKTIVFQSGSQCDRLVKHLLAGNSITPLVARQLFGVERLAARILEIKKAGHKVTSTIKTDVNGKVYAEYGLRNAGRIWTA
ncbi:helix-turn-helix domain-containing protein [Rhizobium leguminosarum]|uniref:helix-turn-helix domain-containing protein n=1 Tax=Rhizobium leguminosarum TaxID=384 RepID=UPI001610BD6E|nr:helix-turn-helix domain-containing protein [Rhizobium leguminosarum]MBB4345235.1 hypothetical protein [Rhizobium leguminosarum]MBB6298306.1 hypothetical protein [Rhizobium leguminosarum]